MNGPGICEINTGIRQDSQIPNPLQALHTPPGEPGGGGATGRWDQGEERAKFLQLRNTSQLHRL